MVTKWGAENCPCFAAHFAKALRMNAKARKREKRRAERSALRAIDTNEQADQDSELWGEPYVPDPGGATAGDAAASSSKEEEMEFLRECLPHSLAAGVTQLLEKSGLQPVDNAEFAIIDDILQQEILPRVAQGLCEMRRVAKDSKISQVRVGLQWGIITEGAGLQAAGEASQDGSQQGAAGSERGPLDGQASDEAAIAKDLTDEETDDLWQAALAQARLEGGDSSVVHSNAVKMYRGMKRKRKAKEKKLSTIA